MDRGVFGPSQIEHDHCEQVRFNSDYTGVKEWLGEEKEIKVSSIVRNVIELNKEVTNISLYDISGKVVKQWENGSRLNIADLSTGVYFLKGNALNKKIIKME